MDLLSKQVSSRSKKSNKIDLFKAAGAPWGQLAGAPWGLLAGAPWGLLAGASWGLLSGALECSWGPLDCVGNGSTQQAG